MRVCFYLGGAEWSAGARAFADAAVALRESGFEVTMACARGGGTERRLAADGFDPIPLRVDGGWLRVGWRLRGVLRRQFVEAVFVHSEREHLHAAAAARLADRGAVVRRVAPLGRLALGGDTRLAMRIAATSFLFAADEDRRAARLPAGALEPAVAPPGIAVSAWDTGRAHLGVGRHIVGLLDDARHARVSTALRAVALLAPRHPDLRFTLVARGEQHDALILHATALGVGGVVELVRHDDSRDALAAQLRSADCAWVLGDGDEAAFAILDAFAAGAPVVAERDPLSARFVRHDETGVLASALDPPGWAALLAELLADAPRRARLAHAAGEGAAAWSTAEMARGFERAASIARDRTRWRV